MKPISWLDANKICHDHNLTLFNYNSESQNSIIKMIFNDLLFEIILPLGKQIFVSFL